MPVATREAVALIVVVAEIWNGNNTHVSTAPHVRLLVSITTRKRYRVQEK